MIFPEALESAEEFARFAELLRCPLLANMTEFGRSPLLDLTVMEAMGYRAVIYPLTALRAAMHAAEETLRELRDTGTQRGALERMQTRAELYDLVEYDRWHERGNSYLNASNHTNIDNAAGPGRERPCAPGN